MVSYEFIVIVNFLIFDLKINYLNLIHLQYVIFAFSLLEAAITATVIYKEYWRKYKLNVLCKKNIQFLQQKMQQK